jgi:hypothetical protein
MNKRLQEREEINKLYNLPENRRLKYIALAVMAVVVVLLLSMTIWLENIQPKVMLIIRGCAGLGALVFVVLVGILTYRVNKQHITDRGNQ